MEKEKKSGAGRPPFDEEKCLHVAGKLSAMMTREVAASKPQSIAEGLLEMTVAMGRVIHVLSAVMGMDPKIMCRDFCGSLTKYFEMGGEGAVNDIVKMYRQNAN